MISLNSDVLVYEPRTVKPDMVSLWPPTELAEGYVYEAIQENYVITDNSRILRIYYVQPLQHVAGMLMAYLPAEGIAFQADLFDTHEAPRAAPVAGDAEPQQPGPADEARRNDARTRSWRAGGLERICGGLELAGESQLRVEEAWRQAAMPRIR